MKKTCKLLFGIVLSAIMMVLFAGVSFAQNDINSFDAQANDIIVTEQYVNDNVSVVKGITRGMLISSVDIQLTRKGSGIANLYGEILCHEPASQIRIVLMLQKLDEADQGWDTVNSQEFNWKASDLPAGEELTMATVSYNIAGLEKGATYRIRGLFGAYNLAGDYNESWSTNGPGITF